MINCLHHFEILTNSSQKLLKYFINGFNFNLVKTNQTSEYKQYLLNSNSINFLVTSTEPTVSLSRDASLSSPASSSSASSSYSHSLDIIRARNLNLYNEIHSKQNTVYNAAFQVRSIDQILSNCKRHNVRVLREKQLDYDRNYGYVQHAMIESCISGVVHSLIDTSEYRGHFLPGFESSNLPRLSTTTRTTPTRSNLTHFDHLTYAIERHTSKHVIDWYQNVFNMKRFMLNKEQENGLMVKTGKSGMNLKCINYWLCAETGFQFDSSKLNDFKFVISEPLDDDQTGPKNQISIFLEENAGPGIQHIGLNSNDIIQTVTSSKVNNLDIKYYSTPDEYYDDKDKRNEIERCGLDLKELKESHVLLDADLLETDFNASQEKLDKYLLQVFTQPIFDKNTVFLELIQRVGGAQGFGAANIKALWNAVQRSIHNVQLKLKQKQ